MALISRLARSGSKLEVETLKGRGDDPAAVLAAPVEKYATIPCRSVPAEDLLQAALRICSERKINELPVIEANGTLAGLLDVQDLVDRGFEI